MALSSSSVSQRLDSGLFLDAKMKKTPALVLLVALAAPLLLGGCSPGETSPYAGQERRSIKALSDGEIAGYLEGRGLGFSKVAELNQHPGPRHVLELAQKLDLSAAQRRQTKAVFDQMERRAQRLGEQLVEQERRLDAMFANAQTSPPDVRSLLDEIGATRAGLRFTHVRAHMQTKNILSPRQVERYDALRGYGVAGGDSHASPSSPHEHGA